MSTTPTLTTRPLLHRFGVAALLFLFLPDRLPALDLRIDDDAWAQGMGGAASAIAGGSHAALVNPAGMASATVPMLQWDGAWRTHGMPRDLRLTFLFPTANRTVFGLTVFNSLSPGSWKNLLLVGGAAIPLQANGDLKVGLNVKVIQNQTYGLFPTSAHGLSLDLGMTYDWRLKSGDALSLALVAHDLSGTVRRSPGLDEDVVRSFTFGVAYQDIPRMRVEADFDIIDKSLGPTPLKNRLRLGAERFLSQRRYSVRLGYDDLLGDTGSFRLGAGWHPDRPYEVQLAGGISEKDQGTSFYASIIYRLDRWKARGRSAEGAPSIVVGEPGKPGDEPTPEVGRPVSRGPLGKVAFTISPLVVSPNGDGKDDVVKVEITGPVDAGKGRWELEIGPGRSNPVKSFSGKGLPPSSLSWDALAEDGRPHPDGKYNVVLRTYEPTGILASENIHDFEIQAVEPQVGLAVSETAFSPNGDGVKDQVLFKVLGEKGLTVQKWRFTVYAVVGKDKAEMDKSGRGKPPLRFPWRGKRGPGESVPDGVYQARLTVSDRAGNERTIDSGPVTVDTREPSVSISPRSMFAQPSKKPAVFTLAAEDGLRIASWRITVSDEGGKPFKVESGEGAPPARWSWDGKGEAPDSPVAKPGSFFGVSLRAVDAAGNRASTEPSALQVESEEADSAGQQMSLNIVTVFFDEKSPVLGPEAVQELRGAVESIRPYLAKSTLAVTGYTAAGEGGDAVKLSHARAAAVRDFLARELKIDPMTVPASGRGDREPLVLPGGGSPDEKQRRAVVTLMTTQ